MEPRWKVKELNAIDLVPERKLLNVFITAPKQIEVFKSYQNFKALSSRKRKHFLYKYRPPPIHSTKVVKYEGPRFSNKIPSTFFKSIRQSQTKSLSPTNRNFQAEYLIENLIKNRKEIVLPTVQSTKHTYKSLKDRLSNTKSNLFQDLSCISQSISDGLKNKDKLDSSRVSWQKSPIRRWEKSKLIINTKKRPKTCIKSPRKEAFKESYLDNGDIIGKVLDSC